MIILVFEEPQPCVEGVSLSEAMAWQGENLHHGLKAGVFPKQQKTVLATRYSASGPVNSSDQSLGGQNEKNKDFTDRYSSMFTVGICLDQRWNFDIE